MNVVSFSMKVKIRDYNTHTEVETSSSSCSLSPQLLFWLQPHFQILSDFDSSTPCIFITTQQNLSHESHFLVAHIYLSLRYISIIY
ncbi:hypothetical protein QVD17_02002 [Tagetes erecta]|uniref:Uncharacterized protein n=1 Tax=Tagetes erecta TaxID=13708 RepID=A0AAD8L8J8_TARER|nr:hypothetical protein QVD17_02002 [Tagetes erecta]